VVLIFGWGSGKAEDLGEIAPASCPNCHNPVFMHHVRSKKSVSLFFVPVLPYGTDEYLVCPICMHGMPVSAAQAGVVSRMRAATAAYRHGRVDEGFYRSEVARFWAGFGVAPSGAQILAAPPSIPAPAATPQAAPGVPGPPGPTVADQLAGLAELHRQGVLTDDEFVAAKARLLGS
jgi:hypothetical protein